ncbi:MAG: hypothetical protein JXC31_05600 [Acholeplasmataceae bacterium]|nr:hypothetical protein [Acholeplasmataceae bacterium]
MKNLIDPIDTLGIIGLSKNSGKTTTLNHIISLYGYLKIGITSIGLDGEALDQINFLPKPKIHVKRGMVVATASGCLEASYVNFQVLDRTNFYTALGRIQIVEILSDGNMVIAGPTTNKELNQVLKKMKVFVDKIIVDGAFNRMTFANIDQIDAIILAAGAAVSPLMNETIKQTKMIVDSFNLNRSYRLDKIPDEMMIIQTTFHHLVYDNKKIETIKHALSEINDKIDMLYIKGAITPKMINFFIERMMSEFTLVCDDPTKLLINEKEFNYLKKLQISINVIHPCPLLCVTINPWSPQGNHYDKTEFKKAMENIISIPIYNVINQEVNHV